MDRSVGAAGQGRVVSKRAASGRRARRRTTDATGAFDLASLVPGRYDVQVMAPGMEWWTGKVDVPSEGTRIEFPRLGAVTGRAHFADGSPAAGVWVMIEGPTYRADTRADADGRFRFDGVPTRGLTLRVGYAFDGTGANVRQLQAKGRNTPATFSTS